MRGPEMMLAMYRESGNLSLSDTGFRILDSAV